MVAVPMKPPCETPTLELYHLPGCSGGPSCCTSNGLVAARSSISLLEHAALKSASLERVSTRQHPQRHCLSLHATEAPRSGEGVGAYCTPLAGVIHDKVTGRVSSKVAYSAAQPSEGETANCLADSGHTRSQAQQRLIVV